MLRRPSVLIGSLGILLGVPLAAPCLAQPAAAQVSVSGAWVRGTVPAQTATGAFMSIRSSRNAAIVGAASPGAHIVEIHESRLENGVMKMREARRVELEAGRPVQFAPGGYHVMLIDLVRKPLRSGDVVPIELTIETPGGRRQTVTVRAEVRDLGAAPPPAGSDPPRKH